MALRSCQSGQPPAFLPAQKAVLGVKHLQQSLRDLGLDKHGSLEAFSVLSKVPSHSDSSLLICKDKEKLLRTN